MADLVPLGETLHLAERDHYHPSDVGALLHLRCVYPVPWPPRAAEVVQVCGVRIDDGREGELLAVWVKRDALVSHADGRYREGDLGA